jgi:hypothetical protein
VVENGAVGRDRVLADRLGCALALPAGLAGAVTGSGGGGPDPSCEPVPEARGVGRDRFAAGRLVLRALWPVRRV